MAARAVIVTGASSGLGMESAVYLAQRGFAVWASMRDLSRRQALDQAAAAAGVSLNVCRLDVTDGDSIQSTVAEVVKRHKSVYGVVNNAGIQLRGYFEDVNDDEIRRVFETNVFGSMAVTRAVVPEMRLARKGRVIFVSSIGGRLAYPALTAYCGSKFALEQLGEALALELAPFGVYVSVVAPPIVKTDIWSRNRSVSVGACNRQSPYHGWFRRSEELADRILERARVTPRDVAQTIGQALEARQPRLRYLIGSQARILVALKRILPESVFSRVQLGMLMRLLSS